ncbi:hypothetical protein [Actinomadura chokoriensis]|uniref:Uncharacterized protein n=1 Tax=Actinomadura chokoriensis TaxID=454156 RepID=A0ABV4QSJ5_9ACTN
MPGEPATITPHEDVFREIARLRGAVSEHFEPSDWRVDTPLGERVVPSPLQAVLSVEWPAGQLLVTDEDGDEYEVTFPRLVNGDPVAEDRAFFIIAFNEATQYYWVIDLDDERPDDPWVHEIDHDLYGDDRRFQNPKRLSRMLAALAAA